MRITLPCRVIRYAKYVEQQHDAELEPGCEMCTSNRLTLEKAWQVVTNEYFGTLSALNPLNPVP